VNDGAPDPGLSAFFDDWLSSAAAQAAPPAEPPPVAPAASLLDALAADAARDATVAAAPSAPRRVDESLLRRLLLFTVAGSTYGVLETFVTEVARVPRLTLVPHVPPWVRGVTNLRGDIVSVIDLRLLQGLEPTSLHAGRLLLARLIDQDFSVGLLVDAVDQIASVPADDVRAPAAPLDGALAPFLSGVCQHAGRLVAVIDMDRLLRSAEIRQFGGED
jgi:chemotaxis signal transduction protein